MISNAAFAQLMQQINLPSAAAEYDRFALYCTQLQEWNQRMNLTAITQPDQVAKLHLLDSLTVLTAAPADLTGMVTVATHDATVYMPMSELVDIAKELERIAAERKKAEENLQRIEAKLANESFTSRAPENVVNAEREKAEKARALIAKLDESAAAMQI